MPQLNLVKAINQALHQEMARDASVLVLGEDVGLNGGVFRVTDGLQKKFGAERSSTPPSPRPASSAPASAWRWRA